MPECCQFYILICCFCAVDVCFPGGGLLSGWSREHSLTIGLCAHVLKRPHGPPSEPGLSSAQGHHTNTVTTPTCTRVPMLQVPWGIPPLFPGRMTLQPRPEITYRKPLLLREASTDKKKSNKRSAPSPRVSSTAPSALRRSQHSALWAQAGVRLKRGRYLPAPSLL